MPEKRPLPSEGSTALVEATKRQKLNEMVLATQKGNQVVQATGSAPSRTSNMEAPIMLLSGHSGEIYSAKFHPEGNVLASAGFDRQIFFWNVYGECDNFHVINSAHSGAILDLHFRDELYKNSSSRKTDLSKRKDLPEVKFS